MAYTPELNYRNSCTLRRIAWAFNMPMTKAINWALEYIVKHLNSEKICKSCKDKSRCRECCFNQE